MRRLALLICMAIIFTSPIAMAMDYRVEIRGAIHRVYQTKGKIREGGDGNIQFKDRATGEDVIISPPYIITECKDCPVPAETNAIQTPAQK